MVPPTSYHSRFPSIRASSILVRAILVRAILVRAILVRVIVTTLGVLLLFAGSGQAQETARRGPPRAVLVLDASGSMWGRMSLPDKRAKVAVARQAISEALKGFRGRLRLGLVAYGHRRKRDCRDAQVILAPDRSLRPSLFNQAVRSVEPLGHTPMTTAIELAADALGGSDAPGTIILLSDGYENCGRNVCSSVQLLRREHPGLRVHVIALAMKPKDYRRIACVARVGGGKLVMATRLEEVTTALVDVLGETVGSGGIGEALSGSAPAPGRAAPSAPAAAPTGPPGLMLAALLGSRGPVAERALHWRVRRVDGGGGGDDGKAIVYEGNAPVPIIQTPAGRYRVEASWGKVRAVRTVEVAPKGTTRANIVLGAGLVRLRAFARKDGKPLDNVYFTLYRGEPGALETIAISHGAKAEFRLPVGAYRVAVQYGFANQERAIHVVPGSRSDVDIVLYFGELALRVVAAPGGPALEQVFYFIYEDAPETASGLREISRSAASHPVFTLPAGTYHVVARHGQAEVRTRVTVRAGMQTRQVLDVRSGRLTLASRIAGASEQLSDLVSYTIVPVGGGDRRAAAAVPAVGTGDKAAVLARTSRPRAAFDLAVGRYRIIGRYGPVNAEASRDVLVRRGAAQEVVLEYSAGTVALRLAKVAGGVALRDVFWELADKAGRVVWTSGRPMPRMPLAAGTYRIAAQYRGKRFETTFSLRVGEDKKIEVLAQ